MRIWTYPIIAFIFNSILFNSFHWGEYGGAIVVMLTVPIIAVTSLILTFIHYRLKKKQFNTTYFQWVASIAIILFSYYLFPSQDTPISILQKMSTVAHNYDKITINDYFLNDSYENYEKTVAAKKKFYKQLTDTSYSVNISNKYDYTQVYKTYGINFVNDRPASTDNKQTIDNIIDDSFRFTEYFLGDTIVYTGNKKVMNNPDLRTDSFSILGAGHFKDTTLKEVNIKQKIKSITPDSRYWAYKIFYQIL